MKHIVCTYDTESTRIESSKEITLKEVLSMSNQQNGDLIDIDKKDDLFKFAKKLGCRLFFKPLSGYKNNIFSVAKVKQAYSDMNRKKLSTSSSNSRNECPEEEDMHGDDFFGLKNVEVVFYSSKHKKWM